MIDQLKIILRPIAVILLLQSFFMFFCAAAAFAFGESESASAFSAAALFAVITALIILFFSKHRAGKAITIRSGFILVILIWTVTGLTGAAPYILSGAMNNPVDAVFESISGFTTTGASILSDIESLPKSVLLWRAFTHFIGGGGIIVLSIAILPLLGIGGTHLMDMETSGINKEKLTPRITQTAKYIWILYLSLNAAAAVLLMIGGMSLTDAFTHASSAIATGGFSNKNNSVAFFSSAYIEWVLIFFMYIG
ncbi:MAG: TrkH family potassium uptake protein, partial [Mucispirillum sp.]|nr:TrkH family potassium uptake protein [Mucispirillum sp.]